MECPWLSKNKRREREIERYIYIHKNFYICRCIQLCWLLTPSEWQGGCSRQNEGMAAMAMARRFLLQRSCRFALPVASQRSLLCDCHPHPLRTLSNSMVLRSGWWFGTFFIFPSIGNSNPNWLIFFRGVETTNQFKLCYKGSSAIWMGGLDYVWIPGLFSIIFTMGHP